MEQEELSCLSMEDTGETELIDEDTVVSVSLSSSTVSDANIILSFINPHDCVDFVGVGIVIIFLLLCVYLCCNWLLLCNVIDPQRGGSRSRFRALNIEKDKALLQYCIITNYPFELCFI